LSQPSLFAADEPLTVSQLVQGARTALEDCFPAVTVKGEISRFVHHGSGHMYFQLKDADASVATVMFRSDNQRLRFHPEDGMDVLVEGRVSLYEPRGQFQCIISRMEPLGLGSLYLAFEQLKTRLAGEGLFDEGRKRPLPLLPGIIGIATSPTGAAIRDVLRVFELRFPDVRVLIAPCRVQGNSAADEIVRSIQRLNRHAVDVIVLARGGGSIEDLWAFNEERVARAVAASSAPVISGIGHEIDLTIADLVADLMAPTPSAAAEMAVRSKLDLVDRLASLRRSLAGATRMAVIRRRERMLQARQEPALVDVPRRLQSVAQRTDELTARALHRMEARMQSLTSNVRLLAERLSPRALARRVQQRRARLALVDHRLRAGGGAALASARQQLGRMGDLLDSYSPLAVLARGYSICKDENGRVIRDSTVARPGDSVEVRLQRGELLCRVEDVLRAEEA
jgi:exodeoxyribonuclease VII large subunit